MPKIVLKTTDEINRGRRRVRWVLLVISVPFLIAVGLLAYKTAMMYWVTQQVITATEEKNYGKAVEAAKQQQQNAFTDQWRADYNSGVTSYNVNDYEESIRYLLKAKKGGPSTIPEVCIIADALSKAYEKAGDNETANGNKSAAEEYYWRGKDVISKAPKNCFPPDSSSDDNQNEGESGESDSKASGESMQQTDKRLDEKLNQDSPDNQPSQSDSGESDRDQIQEDMDEGSKDKQDDDNANSTPPENYEKPW